MTKVSPIPEGYHSVTPHMVIKGAADAIEFYKKAFGAEETYRMPGPNDIIMHAEIRIGNSHIMIADEMPMMESPVSPASLGNKTSVVIALYVEDADAVFASALEAGATEVYGMSDAFWGDRYGKVMDPFGHQWELMTHQEDLTPEEINARAVEFFSQQPEC